jgi:FkbM family methyltransferase
LTKALKRSLRKWLWKAGFKVIHKPNLATGLILSKDIEDDGAISDIRIIFDVGANVGQTTRLFREQFPDSQIYSFEPISNTYEELLANTRNLSNVKYFRVAFGSTDSVVKVFLQEGSVFNSLNNKVNVANVGRKSEDVTVTTVDSFCEQNNIDQIDILKIDTEGFDLEVLYGASRLLAGNKVKYVLTEVGFSDDNERNTPFSKIHEFLSAKGFKLRGFYNQSTNERGYIVFADALYRLIN